MSVLLKFDDSLSITENTRVLKMNYYSMKECLKTLDDASFLSYNENSKTVVLTQKGIVARTKINEIMGY